MFWPVEEEDWISFTPGTWTTEELGKEHASVLPCPAHRPAQLRSRSLSLNSWFPGPEAPFRMKISLRVDSLLCTLVSLWLRCDRRAHEAMGSLFIRFSAERRACEWRPAGGVRRLSARAVSRSCLPPVIFSLVRCRGHGCGTGCSRRPSASSPSDCRLAPGQVPSTQPGTALRCPLCPLCSEFIQDGAPGEDSASSQALPPACRAQTDTGSMVGARG